MLNDDLVQEIENMGHMRQLSLEKQEAAGKGKKKKKKRRAKVGGDRMGEVQKMYDGLKVAFMNMLSEQL